MNKPGPRTRQHDSLAILVPHPTPTPLLGCLHLTKCKTNFPSQLSKGGVDLGFDGHALNLDCTWMSNHFTWYIRVQWTKTETKISSRKELIQEKMEGQRSRFYAECLRGCSEPYCRTGCQGVGIFKKMETHGANTELLAPGIHDLSCHLGSRELPSLQLLVWSHGLLLNLCLQMMNALCVAFQCFWS